MEISQFCIAPSPEPSPGGEGAPLPTLYLPPRLDSRAFGAIIDMQTVCQAAGYYRKDTLSTAEQPAFPAAWISLADLR